MTLAILGALLALLPGPHRPPTIPALREWQATPGAFELRPSSRIVGTGAEASCSRAS